MDFDLATVPGLVEFTNVLGFGEYLNRSCEPFGDAPVESFMVSKEAKRGAYLATSKKDLSK